MGGCWVGGIEAKAGTTGPFGSAVPDECMTVLAPLTKSLLLRCAYLPYGLVLSATARLASGTYAILLAALSAASPVRSG